MKKVNDPGVWVVTAAGHIGKDESPENAVNRELYEELGFKVDLQFYKKIFHKYKNKESRFFWIYYSIIKDKPKIKLDKEEVEKVIWISPKELIKFSRKHNWDVNGLSHKYIMEMYEKFFTSA
jgi:8-oxo-dGTP pyrophosphatase MutT (NUDIX family)